MSKLPEKVFISGLVIPSEWNKDGQALEVVIKTFDEDEYFIAENKSTTKLLKLLREQVEIDGIVIKKGLKKYLTECNLKTPKLK